MLGFQSMLNERYDVISLTRTDDLDTGRATETWSLELTNVPGYLRPLKAHEITLAGQWQQEAEFVIYMPGGTDVKPKDILRRADQEDSPAYAVSGLKNRQGKILEVYVATTEFDAADDYYIEE